MCVGRRITKGPTQWRAAEPEHRKLFYAIVRRLKFLSFFCFGNPSTSVKQGLYDCCQVEWVTLVAVMGGKFEVKKIGGGEAK